MFAECLVHYSNHTHFERMGEEELGFANAERFACAYVNFDSTSVAVRVRKFNNRKSFRSFLVMYLLCLDKRERETAGEIVWKWGGVSA